MRDFQKIVLFLAFFALQFCVAGCRTSKINESVEYRDSAQVTALHDTTAKHTQDSTAKTEEKQSDVEIEFAEGGKWNTQTGEAENVQRVKVRGKRTVQTVQTHKQDSMASNVELTAQAGEELERQKEVEPQKRSKWDRFTTAWTVSTWVVLLLALVLLVWKKRAKIMAWLLSVWAKLKYH